MAGAMELFSLAAKVVLDKDQFDKGVNDADKSGKNLADNLTHYMGKAKKVISGLFTVAAVKKAASAVWNLAKETSAAGDRIDKMSQSLGMSRKKFQEWDYILAQNGASIDDLGMAMKTLQNAINGNSAESAAALSKLGLSAAQLSRMSPEEQFEAVVKALQNMPDGAEKSQLAMQLLGKNAMSLMPLLNSSADSVEELRRRAHELGLIMSDEDVDASVAFGDALDDLNKVWSAVKMKFGAKLLPGFTKGLVEAANALGRLANAIEDAFKSGDWSGVFKVLTEEISRFVPGLIDTLVNMISGIFENADKIVDLAISIVTGLTDGIIKSLPILIKKLPQIGKSLLNGFKNIGKSLGNGIIDIINTIFGTNIPKIEDIQFPSLSEMWAMVTDWWDGGNGVRKLLEDACKWVLKLFGMPEDSAESIAKNVGDWFGGIVSFIVDACSWVLGLFGLPTNVDTEKLRQDVETWFSGFSNILASACNWVLGLFGLPPIDEQKLSADVSTWFGGFSKTIIDACSWILGLFGLPTDVDGAKLGQDVEEWFSGFSSIIVGACNWVLGLFGLPEINVEQLSADIGTWFGGFSQTIIDACSWVLGLFGLPTDVNLETLKADVSKWFSGLSGAIIEACNWVLELFGLPQVDTAKLKEDVGKWFDGLVGTITGACQWVLSLFGLPTDVNKEQLAEDVGKWFDGIAGVVSAACEWVLSIFQVPQETKEQVTTLITNWWGTIRSAVEGAVTWVLSLFGFADSSEYKKHFREWWEGEDGEGGMKAVIKQIANWALGALGLPDVDKIQQQIREWWNQVVSDLVLSVFAVFGGIKGNPAVMPTDSNGNWDYNFGSGTDFTPYDWSSNPYYDPYDDHFAKGSRFIPYDNFSATLHRGEAVLTADQARRYREGGGGDIDPERLYQAVASAVQSALGDIQINMDGVAVGNAVTAQVSRNIYQAQLGRRFTTI